MAVIDHILPSWEPHSFSGRIFIKEKASLHHRPNKRMGTEAQPFNIS